jgi:hypothetical protein
MLLRLIILFLTAATRVAPLGLSLNRISIRVIDCRYGDICYVSGAWTIFLDDERTIKLHNLPYIKQKIELISILCLDLQPRITTTTINIDVINKE